MRLVKNLFNRSVSPLHSAASWLIIGVFVSVLLLSGKVEPAGEQPYLYATLPHDPYPYTMLPIKSKFEEGKLEPFELLAAFDQPGFGQVSFQESYLEYKSGSWSWLAIRTSELQNVINARWVWKPLEGREFIIEAWNARPDRIGHTAMIVFRNGKVYQSMYPVEICLMDFDPYKTDWVTVQMIVDYTIPEIRDLWINEYHFSQLRIVGEPIGPTDGFWQMQIFLPENAAVLVKEMQTWK
jgi:hypothetical protein